ncbi:microtubule-associated protein CRIPT-domain-containing protein [Pavlovales sp. CCMP2436]|nr:microtubule-associated protein CRIPT-domain-containing protein [Pavlovales sp. CCMP2436]
MVCGECESKLSRGACPDPWKSGSTNNNQSGARRIGENKALGKSYAAHRHNPYTKNSCAVCKQPVSQNAGKYCQSCAYAKGVCAICGKQVLDTRFYAMGDGTFGKGKKLHDPASYKPDGWQPEGAPAAEGEAAPKPKKRKAVAAASTAAPHVPSAGAAGAAGASGSASAEWQLDAATGFYFCVAAQAYYDASTKMFFVRGVWMSALPESGSTKSGSAAQQATAGHASSAPAEMAVAATPEEAFAAAAGAAELVEATAGATRSES